MINYGMFCADSLLYLSDSQAIQSSVEFRNGGEISSNSFGVLLNNNWPLLINLEVFNGFATSYFPYYFWASNLFPEHDAEAFEYDEETCILLDHSLEMLLVMKLVLLVQHTLFLATDCSRVQCCQDPCASTILFHLKVFGKTARFHFGWI